MKRKMMFLIALIMSIFISVRGSCSEEELDAIIADDGIITEATENAWISAPCESEDLYGQETEANSLIDAIESADGLSDSSCSNDGDASSAEDDPIDEAVQADNWYVLPVSGMFGDNLYWTLDTAGTLTISGNGDMTVDPHNVNWGTSSAYWAATVKKLVIEDGVTSIYDKAFSYFTNLTEASIAGSVTTIGEYAFWNCTSLASVEISYGVITIGDCAFSGCKALTALTFPESLVSIGSGVCQNCSSLQSIRIPDSVTSFSGGFSGCTSLEEVYIGKGVSSVKSNMFSCKESLRKLTICAKSIETGAFSNYTGIEELIIGETVENISKTAFEGCTNLKTVSISNGLLSIGNNAFKDCTSLKAITIPDSVTSIGTCVFSGCTSLTEAKLPETITSIPDYTFEDCTGLVNFKIPKNVTVIGGGAFYNCTKISDIEIPDSMTSIKHEAFYNCSSLKTIIIPDGVDAIYFDTFSGCSSLTSITFGKGINLLDTSIMKDCTSLKEIYFTGNPPVFTENSFSGVTATAYYPAGNSSWTESHLKNWGGTITWKAKAYSTVLDTCKISSLTNTSSGIKIKWSEVSGADGYYIYRKTSSGSYSRIKTIKSGSTVSYTDKKVVDKNGVSYTYKVVPYSGDTKGTGITKTTVRLTGTTLTSVKNSAAGKMKVKWTVVTSVTGYQIQYSTSKIFASGNKTKKVSGATSVSKTLGSLTVGKTYYVRIRTYKTVNGTTYYSAWSSKLKVKVIK